MFGSMPVLRCLYINRQPFRVHIFTMYDNGNTTQIRFESGPEWFRRDSGVHGWCNLAVRLPIRTHWYSIFHYAGEDAAFMRRIDWEKIPHFWGIHPELEVFVGHHKGKQWPDGSWEPLDVPFWAIIIVHRTTPATLTAEAARL